MSLLDGPFSSEASTSRPTTAAASVGASRPYQHHTQLSLSSDEDFLDLQNGANTSDGERVPKSGESGESGMAGSGDNGNAEFTAAAEPDIPGIIKTSAFKCEIVNTSMRELARCLK